MISTGGGREFALEARSARGWRRVMWLDFIAKGYPERRRYRIGASERHEGDLIIMLEYHSRGGNCDHTVVQAWRLRESDLDDPVSPERRARLLGQVRQDEPFAHWRTLAEMGPLPPDRLVEALEAAETAGRSSLAARWWRESTSGLTADQLAALTMALKEHPGLHGTRSLLGLAASP